MTTESSFHKFYTDSRSDDKVSKSITWSLGFHGILLILLLVKSFFFPSKTVLHVPTLRVDLVGLPEILKKDLTNVANLPPAPPPPSNSQKESVNEPSAPSFNAPKNISKPTTKDLNKQKEKESKNNELRAKQALARIKALQRFKETDTPSTEKGVIIKGNQISTGTSLSPDAKEAAEASYFDLIRDRLRNNWALPIWIARQNLSATVVIFVSPDGMVKTYKITKSSGNAQFDEAIRQTLNQSLPLPKPPTGIQDDLQSTGISLGFPL